MYPVCSYIEFTPEKAGKHEVFTWMRIDCFSSAVAYIDLVFPPKKREKKS